VTAWLTKSADELMTATTLEAGEEDLLIYCVNEGETDIFGKKRVKNITPVW